MISLPTHAQHEARAVLRDLLTDAAQLASTVVATGPDLSPAARSALVETILLMQESVRQLEAAR